MFLTLLEASVVLTCAGYFLAMVFSNVDVNAPWFIVMWHFLVFLVCYVIILYVFGQAAAVHTQSSVYVGKLSDRNWGSRIKNKFMKRFFTSCPPIKISFGFCNFIEKKTPLKFIEFSCLRFVDLLLLGKK